MVKLLVVVGATGGQGGSVIKAFLQRPEWRLRGLTRNPNGARAKELSSQGVEIVAADINDVKTLSAVFSGAAAIFAVTDFVRYSHCHE